jgi:hypothetical protein
MAAARRLAHRLGQEGSSWCGSNWHNAAPTTRPSASATITPLCRKIVSSWNMSALRMTIAALGITQ